MVILAAFVAGLILGILLSLAHRYINDKSTTVVASKQEEEEKVYWNHFNFVSMRVLAYLESIDLEEVEVPEMCRREIALDSFARSPLGEFTFLVTNAIFYYNLHGMISLRLRGVVVGVGPCQFTLYTDLESGRFTITEDGKRLEGYGSLTSGGDFKLFVTTLVKECGLGSLHSLRQIEGLVIKAVAHNRENKEI